MSGVATAPGWSSFRSAGCAAAGQVGAGSRAQSRCQQVRNASFQGQSGLISRTRRKPPPSAQQVLAQELSSLQDDWHLDVSRRRSPDEASWHQTESGGLALANEKLSTSRPRRMRFSWQATEIPYSASQRKWRLKTYEPLRTAATRAPPPWTAVTPSNRFWPPPGSSSWPPLGRSAGRRQSAMPRRHLAGPLRR
jgi:hypothetical protein